MYIDMKSIFYYRCALKWIKIQSYFMTILRKIVKKNQKLGLIHLGLSMKKSILSESIRFLTEIREDKLNKYLHNK